MARYLGSIPAARFTLLTVQIPRPPAVGDPGVVSELRAVVISEPLLGGASARPKGFVRAQWGWAAGWMGPLIARRATDPLPPTVVYVAVTPTELRLFSKSLGLPPFEIGRWRRGAYRASLTESMRRLRLDLQLDRLGRVTLTRGPFFEGAARPVFDLVVENSSGPVATS